MKYSSPFFSLVFLLILTPAVNAQQYSFPEDWEGNWQGELKIFSRGKMAQKVPMTLEISNEQGQRGKFAITYGAGTEANTRVYSWQLKDSSIGHFVIDEQNGIFLDAFLVDNCLIERFDIMESALTGRFCLQDSNLVYEILSTSTKPSWNTGDTIMGSDTIPPVDSYFIPVLQKARLSREY